MSRRLRRLACCAGIAVVALVAAPSSGAPASSRVTFATFHEPGAGRDGGEPTIGASWRTGNVMFQSSLRSLRVTFNGTSSTWTESSAPTARNVSLDPMLYTDPVTGRTFVSQLLANCSSLAYTDNDGLTWSPGMGCGLGVAVDHQSIGGGPFPAGIKPTGTYPHAVYYCAQALVDASCARSDDGGLTFGPEYPMYLLTDCGGLHGMPRVAPDGTVYVPNSDCGGAQGVVVSSDGGRTWAISTIDGSKSPGESDPAVAIGSRGTAYVGWQNGDTNETHPYVAVSKNAGRSWSRPVDVGKAFGIKNVQFPAMVAGDDGRAAFAFLGSTTDGDDQAAAYTGTWHVYVATTYDAGAHWTTVDATPKELAQRGCIWMAGAENECRNLLDFMGMTVDKQGRVLVGWADGCSGVCEHGGANTFTATATISRQSGGRGLFAAYDGRW